jgi:glycosyltransferase involved in cell wall biosynthesis
MNSKEELRPEDRVKYLHVVSSLNPEGGGPAEGVRQLCDKAQLLGHRCEVATLDASDAAWLTGFPCGVRAFGPARSTYRYAPKLLAWLRENAGRYEAIIVNGLWQYHGFAVWRALRGKSTPYFVFTHGMLDPWFKREYPLKHVKKWLYWPWAEYRVLRDARAVLFTCEEERLLARKSFWLYRANEAVVRYGTPGPSGDVGAQREAFLSRYPELRGKRVLLFLGRVHPKKGCDLLVRAFSALAGTDPTLHLVMAGPDPSNWQEELQRPLLATRLERRVTWTGMLTGDLKWGALFASEAFVLPSHQENFGIAVAEALACGVPVLISNKVNIWREVSADEAGLVANDTLEGTMEVIESWLAATPTRRAQLASNALHCFRNRFHIDAAARSLLSVLDGSSRVDGQNFAA